MNKRERHIFAAAAAAMVLAALFLSRWDQMQRLGEPGLKVVPVPIAGLDLRAEGTNRHFVAGTNSVDLPERVLNYRSEVQPVQKIVWDWLPKDTVYGQRLYWAPDKFQLLNLVVLMGTDRTSIHQPQYCLNGSGWTIVKSERARVPIAKPEPYELPVMKLTTRGNFPAGDGGTHEMSGVFVYWFVADGQRTADHKERMWWMAKDLITRATLQRWAYVVCFAPCLPGQEEATFARIQEFIAASVPEYHLPHPPEETVAIR